MHRRNINDNPLFKNFPPCCDSFPVSLHWRTLDTEDDTSLLQLGNSWALEGTVNTPESYPVFSAEMDSLCKNFLHCVREFLRSYFFIFYIELRCYFVLYMRACAFPDISVCMWMWRPENNLGVILRNAVHVHRGPKVTSQSSLASQWVSPRAPPGPTSAAQGFQEHALPHSSSCLS